MTASTTADPNFAILTSLRYDEALVDASGSPGQHGCPLYMPVVHRQRLVTSWHALGWDEGDERGKRPLEGTVEGFVAWVLGEVREWQGEHEEQLRTPLKVRLALADQGQFRHVGRWGSRGADGVQEGPTVQTLTHKDPSRSHI